MTLPHPDDLRSVTAANRDRLMGLAAAIQTITAPIDLSKKESRK